MIESIILILIFVFTLLNIPFLIIFSKKYITIPKSNDGLLSFSIIVAAKNEENNIPGLINSLKELNFPAENFEVIIIDDNSNDKTFELTEKLIKDLQNFFIFKVEKKKFPAKKGALNFGISKTKNPFIVITDADCLPEKDWLNYYNLKFNKDYDFLFGVSPFIKEKTFVNKISCFENFRNTVLTITTSELGFPHSAASRNFGFKKSSFFKIKGYENTTKTLSGDDDLLLKKAIKNKLKIGTILNENSFVYSRTKKTFKEYLHQRSRHTKTSLYYLPSQKLLLSLWHLINLFFLFSPFLIFVNCNFIFLFLFKFCIDIIIVSAIKKKLKYKFNFFEIIYLQIFYEIFLIVHFFNALFKKDKWK